MQSRWEGSSADKLGERELLAHVSRLMGEEAELVLAGGGNTSVKLVEPDHLGRPVARLLIKPSGIDLAAISASDFTALRMDDLAPLVDRPALSDEDMVVCVMRSMVDPRERRPSIETLLHAFLPDRWVLHSHADAVLALGNRSDGAERLRHALGDQVAVVPYRRPGFLLAQEVASARRAHPGAIGIVLHKHGLITVGDSGEEAYARHLELVTRCEQAAPVGALPPAPPAKREAALRLAPVLRGALDRPRILAFDDSEEVRAFVAQPELCEAITRGPATADHILRMGRFPCIARSAEDVLRFKERSFSRAVSRDREGLGIGDPAPRALLVPDIGLWTAGDTREQAEGVREIVLHTMRMVRRAGPGWEPIGEEDALHAEYWPLQNRKLSDSPEGGELKGRIAWISGASSGIGRVIAHRFAEEGAHLMLVDIEPVGLAEVVEEVGTHAVGLACNVASEGDVEESFRRTVLEFGGLDLVVSNAGIARPAPIEELSLQEWEASMAVNATAHFLVARAAMRILRPQGLGGSIILNASKNVFSPGKGFAAYSASKAAENQLGKVLALEAAELGVRVNMLHPDAVFAGTKLWSRELREQRARAHGVPVEALEHFYARRNLLQVKVRASDVAEAALFFASDRSSRTTGACLTIDGGIKDAFPR